MIFWYVVAVLAVVALAAGFVWWMRRSRHPKHRLVSIVALLREPRLLDPGVLAHVAGRILKADLGDGTNEGADGFVVGVPPMYTIMHQGRMILINSFPTTYVEDVGEVARGIADARLAGLFAEHEAWFSVDALGLAETSSEEEVRAWYRVLGPLFADLLDDDCLLIFLPETSQAYAINEETQAALRSPDPVESLAATRTVPIIQIAEDDPAMKRAAEEARRRWLDFVEALEAGAGENFSVKAPVQHGGSVEFIWIKVTAVEGDRIYGTLSNNPNDLGPLKLGSKVSVDKKELNDWCYVDRRGQLIGGFTIKVLENAARNWPKQREK